MLKWITSDQNSSRRGSQGARESFKYHMAKWVSISKPRIFGGLGILDTMNQCLITKWIWKLEKGSKELWYRLLQAKYLKKGFFFSTLTIWGLHSFGKDSTKLNTCFIGVQNTM